MGSSTSNNIAELQILRGIGIIFVMIHHINGNLFTWSNEYTRAIFTYFDGSPSLDMFFVLSGFLICRLLLNDLKAAKDRHHSLQISCVFWARRAWRLLPAAWAWIGMALLLTAFVNKSGTFGSISDAWGGALSAALHVANFKYLDCFLSTSFCGPTFPYWTLSLEEQFYVFLPLLIIFSGKWFLRIIFAIAITQFFIPDLLLLPAFRLQGFLLGVLLSIWSRSSTYEIFEPTFLGNNKWVRRLVVSILVLWMCTVQTKFVPHFLHFQLSAIVGGFLVYLASFNASYLWQDGWFKRFGVWLGARSYSMYLCHIPMFFLTREIALRALGPEAKLGAEHAWYLVLTATVLIVVASDLTYRLVETPMRTRGMRITSEMKKRQQEKREGRSGEGTTA
jgi:peptidoglycan/LPS O-acetylase OafA/YrhL